VGFDWSPTLLDGLRSGLIDSLVVQDPFKMGHDSVKSAVEKLNGGRPIKMQNLPPLLVTKENLDDPARTWTSIWSSDAPPHPDQLPAIPRLLRLAAQPAG
jgi:ABC-type sugar transport system substrate-binding protein